MNVYYCLFEFSRVDECYCFAADTHVGRDDDGQQ